MASIPFTLAALASSAVPGLNVSGVRSHSAAGSGAFSSAVLATDRGPLIARIPETAEAEVQQSAELLAIAALAVGVRERLPFAIPETLGITRAGDTRAVVSTFLPGQAATLQLIDTDAQLRQCVLQSIVAIHQLPASIVRDGGLPVYDADQVRTRAVRLVQRTADTGLLPATVHDRWREVLGAENVWSFEPLVVHGSLSAEHFLVNGKEISGVLGWHELSVGDPARDVAWLLSAGDGLLSAALAKYSVLCGASEMQDVDTRARFYHELEVAKWLLHGIESHDTEVVDDAVTMFDRLVNRLNVGDGMIPRQRSLSQLEVERMLEETPKYAYDARSETAEYESLDEDRTFTSDIDVQ